MKENRFFKTLVLSRQDRPFRRGPLRHIHEIHGKGAIVLTILLSPDGKLGHFQKQLLDRQMISGRRERTFLPRRDE